MDKIDNFTQEHISGVLIDLKKSKIADYLNLKDCKNLSGEIKSATKYDKVLRKNNR